MKSVLVIITQPDGRCPSCDLYKATQHNKLLELLSKHPEIGLCHFEASYGTDGERKLKLLTGKSPYYHPELLTVWWKWFPSFMLFSSKHWIEKDKPLEGFIHGGEVKLTGPSGMRQIEEEKSNSKNKYDARAESVYKWLVGCSTTDLNYPPVRTYRDYKNELTDIRLSMLKRQKSE